jgi:myosin protein heavy chain
MMDYESDPGWQYLRLDRERLAEEQAKPFNSKTAAWLPDKEEGFLLCEIKSAKGDMVTVVTSKGQEVNAKKDVLQEVNPPKFTKCEDISTMSYLNEASVLWNLRDRYCAMLIYTYSGLFCVVINPFKRLPIYTDSVARMYMGKKKTEMPPHLFAASDEAYRNMLQDSQCQSMLITGESGAGKTENTKKVIVYFASVGAKQAEDMGAKTEKKGGPTLEDQIVQTNPVLEAFGNAKTVRNNNSSRFGKFIRIHFSRDGRVAACDIEHYLLEKSRVIRQAPGERAYHIFYQMMSGAQAGLTDKLLLNKGPKDYWYVNQAETTIKGVDDKEEFLLTDEAFDVLNFSGDEKADIYRLCSALTHMGDMKFKQRGEQAEVDDSVDEHERAAKMYGVDTDAFITAFCKPRVKVGTEWVNKGQTAEQVLWSKGAMAKAVFNRLFDWLVMKCNLTLDASELQRAYFVGVLDIAGFEIFDFNSFEQLWINFVNEKLQQFFNHHMFVLEQEEYQREGIVWQFIDFGLDLAAGIELIEKPMGIISMLDEECVVPKGSDLSLAQKYNDTHLGKHPNFEKPKPPKGKQAEAHFALKQYAGTVRYNVTAWLEKNKDPLNDTVVSVLKGSNDCKLINTIWADYETQEEAAKAGGGGGKKKGKSASMMTVSMKYREGLNNLMTMLHSTHPHFIRCLIPNELKTSGLLEAELVMNQLTCNGVLEGIRICRKGFPNRCSHPDFKQRYTMLCPEAGQIKDEKSAVETILAACVAAGGLVEENFRVGYTKVFFKAGILAKMEDLREERLSAILSKFQGLVRWYISQKDYKDRAQQMSGFTIVQKNIKNWSVLRNWPWYAAYGLVKPHLKSGKMAEEQAKMEKLLKEHEETLVQLEAERKVLEDEQAKLKDDRDEVMKRLARGKEGVAEAQKNADALGEENKVLVKQITDLTEREADILDKASEAEKAAARAKSDYENLKRSIEEQNSHLAKAAADLKSKEEQIRALQDEMAAQDEAVAKLNKEKKALEENNRKMQDDLQAEEDKANHLNRSKGKGEQKLDDLEDELERAKRVRGDTEKAKRKVEGDLKLMQEKIDETSRAKMDAEATLKKREAELAQLTSRREDESNLVSKLQRQIKDLQNRLTECEEELESERQGRSKADRTKADLQREIEALAERLDEAGGATGAQVEVSKKRDAELAKVRRDLEEAHMSHDGALGGLRKKHNEAVAAMGEQLDQLAKTKGRMDKEMADLQRELDDLHASVDSESKQKNNLDKVAKQLELHLAELQAKSDEQNRQLQDLTAIKQRLTTENADMSRQIEEIESQCGMLNRLKGQLTSQIDDAKANADDEARERQALSAQCKNFEHEIAMMKEQIDETIEQKNEIMRQLSKTNAEIQAWRSKFENEGLLKAEELEDAKKKLQAQVNERLEALDAANAKLVSLEKAKSRLQQEVDDALLEVERNQTYVSQLEKKQKGFDKILEEWKHKCDIVSNDLDSSQRDSRNLSTELFKLQTQSDELAEQMETTRRENKSLAQEIKDLTDQLGEGGRNVHEMQKTVRRLEIEKEELHAALDEAEAALESEESKVLRAQTEVTQVKSEIDRRIQEKEEEFENTRKNHARAIDSMQASIEAESRARAELSRVKKKLETDINDLEIALDHANKSNLDAQTNLRTCQEQIKELQHAVEDEHRQRDQIRESLLGSERKCTVMQAEKDELLSSLSSAERTRKQAEYDAEEARQQCNELSAENASVAAAKRKAETELQALQGDLDEAMNELKSADDNAKKAMSDAARLAEELRQEQEHSMHQERMRKGLEQQLKEMQTRLDEAEAAALQGGKKVIAKLEVRIRELEGEIDGEQRRHQESVKTCAKLERRVKELSFQIDEDKKTQTRLNELVDKLQNKLKGSKKQVEEAEEVATTNLQKYRGLQHQLEDAEERADMAENGLSKLRARNRSSASLGPAGGLSASRSGIFSSPSQHF